MASVQGWHTYSLNVPFFLVGQWNCSIILKWWIHVITCLFNPTENTTPKVNPNVQYELWMTMMCQCMGHQLQQIYHCVRNDEEWGGSFYIGSQAYMGNLWTFCLYCCKHKSKKLSIFFLREHFLMERLSGGKNIAVKTVSEWLFPFSCFFLFTKWLRQEGISVIFPEPWYKS